MKKVLFYIALILLPMLAGAKKKVMIDGIYYNLYAETKTAEVTSNTIIYYLDVTIPESFEYGGITYSVTSIGKSAFYNCYGLTSIIIPKSVTSIEAGAFQYCSSLTTITIPSSVTSIGGVFGYCYGLTSIKVDEANTHFKSVDGTLMSNDGKTLVAYPTGKAETAYTIPDGVTSIGSCAFLGCSGLTTITLPSSVYKIGNSAFSDCSGLTTITLPNSVYKIGNGAFSGCI